VNPALAYFSKNSFYGSIHKLMEPFIHCRVSLEINHGQMDYLDASDVMLFTVKVTPK